MLLVRNLSCVVVENPLAKPPNRLVEITSEANLGLGRNSVEAGRGLVPTKRCYWLRGLYGLTVSVVYAVDGLATSLVDDRPPMWRLFWLRGYG
jgi:hypothetical protein